MVCCLWVRLRPPEQAPLALNKTDILLTCPGPATAVGAYCCGRVVVCAAAGCLLRPPAPAGEVRPQAAAHPPPGA